MAQTLPEGAFILPADIQRIEAAFDDLVKSNGAHASVNVKVNLHVHFEYPKSLRFGNQSVIVHSEAEEVAARAAHAPKDEAETVSVFGHLIKGGEFTGETVTVSVPTEADLDAAVARAEEEQKAKEATTKPKNGKPKPVAVGK